MNPSVKYYLRKLRPVNGWNDSTKASVRCLSRVMREQIPVYSVIFLCTGSQDNLSRYGNYATGWITEESWFDSRQGQVIFLFSSVQTGSGAHSASCQWAPGVKRPAHEADHSSTSSVEVKKEWSCTWTPAYAFMTWVGTTVPAAFSCILCRQCISIHMPSYELDEICLKLQWLEKNLNFHEA